MSASEALRAMQRFELADISVLLGGGGLVVIAPHPDDESLACGGLIAAACAAGRRTKVIIVSDGTGSHPRSRAYPRARLRALRESEARSAVGALGLPPRDLESLRLPDRFVPRHGPAADAAVDRIVEAANRVGASALFVSWRHDPHCDHEAAYHLARRAQARLDVKLYEYSVWGAALDPSAQVTAVVDGFRLPMERHRERKRRAVAAHRSQVSGLIRDDPSGFRLSPRDLARFAGPFESFLASGV